MKSSRNKKALPKPISTGVGPDKQKWARYRGESYRVKTTEEMALKIFNAFSAMTAYLPGVRFGKKEEFPSYDSIAAATAAAKTDIVRLLSTAVGVPITVDQAQIQSLTCQYSGGYFTVQLDRSYIENNVRCLRTYTLTLQGEDQTTLIQKIQAVELAKNPELTIEELIRISSDKFNSL